MYKKYSLAKSFVIHDVDNELWIPPDPANSDYQTYLAWVAEGNQPEEAEQ